MKKIALFLSIFGAFLVANLNYIGYFCWIIANLIWLKYAYDKKEKELFMLWLYYIIISCYGVYNLI